MRAYDTGPEIEAMQIQIRRSMSPGQRLRVACEISDLAHALRKAGIRRDHPEWTERQVIHELIRQAFRPNPVPEGLEKFMREREAQERASSNTYGSSPK